MAKKSTGDRGLARNAQALSRKKSNARSRNHELRQGFSRQAHLDQQSGQKRMASGTGGRQQKSAQTRRGAPMFSDAKRGASRPISRVLSWTIIPLGPLSPAASSDLPGSPRGDGAFLAECCFPIWSCSGWGLPKPRSVATRAVRSYRTFSPLPGSCDP